MANSGTKCPADLSCAEELISYDGIVSMCTKGHITTLKAPSLGFTKLPESLNNMTYLQFMNVADNKLTQLPVLDKLSALTTIYIYSNKLTNITGVFVNSSKMQHISASDNSLTELPPEWGKMTLLKNLNVANNVLSTIPKEYKNLTKLKNLDLSGNVFHCNEVQKNFTGIFADMCIQSQQKTEKEVDGLPLNYSGDPTHAGLDGYEISAIIMAVLFICLLIPSVYLYTKYRGSGVVSFS